ncbi:MAG: hypothetical protein MI924_21615 [Chloroflexales bacterium]|nr:hypothetical protein [Chloroflexales bacterium]
MKLFYSGYFWNALLALWLAIEISALARQEWQRWLLRKRAFDPVWLAQANELLLSDPPDIEQLARLLRERLTPISILIITHDETQNQAIVELAIGASGRHLQGFEEMAMPWSSFITAIENGACSDPLREASQHPFNHKPGNYLLLPLKAASLWVIVKVANEQTLQARQTLQPLALSLSA